jgi:anti-sigma regulatory factor (Ser/Thr protein kinase)
VNISLPGDLQAPGAARTFVQGHLGKATRDRDLVDTVVLVASELVTNAVRAGATDIGLSLEITPEAVELLVDDDAGGWPTPTHADDQAVGGRGLVIVERLSDRWEVLPRAASKQVKAVWVLR